jgi:zinc protease
MTVRAKTALFVIVAALLASLPATRAQETAAGDQARALSLTAPVPADPDVATGTLPNGLRYYIRANRQPANRAELRLAVNAGSILEEDDQQGLAHFVEHMSFNGTAHFPKQEIVAFMQSIGMRFGPSVNAATSFDDTVYMLQIPTDKPEVMDTSLLILEDWAHNVTFDPVEIDKERGVITEEWRLGRGAAARMRDQQLPVLLKGSRYADRLPIGKKSVIDTFKPERLKQFYTDWYRPDLMAVIAVGDFDKAAVEALVKKHFGALPTAAAPKPRPKYDVPAQPGTSFSVASDKETPTTSVAIYNKLGDRDPSTVSAYRQSLVERLYTGMFNRRTSELTQKPDPPFVSGGAGRGSFVHGMQAATLSALVKEDGIERGIEGLLVEANRVATFGFTLTELDRQKKDMLRAYERQYTEREKQESSILAGRYVANFTERQPMPSEAGEYALVQRFLPEITLQEVNALSKDWMGERNRVVMVAGPQKPGLVLPDETKLAAAIARAGTKDVTAYVDTVATAALIDKAPVPGRIVTSTTLEGVGITEWGLSNGARVVIKPTTNKQDEVVFRAFSFGGTSLASDADFPAVDAAAQIVGSSGIGQFSAIQLRNLLAGKVASTRPSISETEQGLSGGGSAKDLETIFQLIYLGFTAPRVDPAVYSMLTTQMKTVLKNQAATPAYAFSTTMQTTLSQDHPRYKPLSAELVDAWNADKALAFYKERFGDASGFTFVFVGSFTPETIKPLVEQYLASLPSAGRKDTWKDVGMRRPAGVVEKTVTKGMEPQSRVGIVFSGPFQYDQAHRVAIRALGSVLEARLRDIVREELGGTYGISASPSYVKVPVSRYDFSIAFGCSPQRTDELVKAVFKDIEALQANGPTEKQVSDAREAFLREYETSVKDNSYLLTQILFRYQYGEDVKAVFTMPDHYKQLTPAAVQDAARTYLKKDNFVRVTLLPEATGGSRQ